MPIALIYRPDKNAMQSGKAKMKVWRLKFKPEAPMFVEGLMGWSGMRDMTREIDLRFPTREAAVAYAEKNGIPYEVRDPQPRKSVKRAYADNFKFGKIG